jgi:23S rRNA C2498 (ribose-2'-O)-methylase RlmM
MATVIKTGGRTKGTVNRTTKETKEILQKIISNDLDNISDLLNKLEPKQRIDAVIKLLPYIVPKQTEVSVTEPELPRKILIKINRKEQ